MQLKSFCLALAIIASLSMISIANAADVVKPHPVKQVVLIPSAPIFSWAGPYLGIQDGFASNKFKFYENSFGILEQPIHKHVGGLFAGYNFAFSQHAILGLDGELNLLPLKMLKMSDSYISDSDDDTGMFYRLYQEMPSAAARLRLGYSLGPFLPYLAGGLTITRTKSIFGAVEEGIPTDSTGFHVYTGWNVGAGFDVAATNNVILRVDYSLRKTANHRLQYKAASGEIEEVSQDKGTLKSEQVRFGVAYKF